jgi:adenylate cyclase
MLTDGTGNEKVQRRLVAILAADIAGYSALMRADEEATVRDLKAHQSTILPMIKDHNGRVIDTAGDGILAEFGSVVNAVECAVALQKTLAERNTTLEAGRQMRFRIGINLGDVIHDETRVYGDGVNIAARLENLAAAGGICISEKVHQEVRGKIDVTFEDLGRQQLKNIAEPVRVYRVEFGKPSSERPNIKQTLALPEKPSIAVLPFNNMSSDPEQEYFADGIVEDIITGLSRGTQFFVIARNSTFTYKGKAVDVRQVGHDLGVRYVLEGSVRKIVGRVRITAQLIDAGTGHHVWADRYDGELAEVFDLQDRITSSVIGAIQPALRIAEIQRAQRKRPESLDAYDLHMQALPHVAALERAANVKGRELLQKSLQLDPSYPMALSMAAWCHAQRCVYNWTEDFEQESGEALRLAEDAVRSAGTDPFALAMLGAAHTLVRDFQTARGLLDRALVLDPNCAWGWSRYGWLNCYVDQPAEGIQCFEKAIRLSPLDPINFNCFAGIGSAHYIEGRHESAIEWLEKAINANPRAYWAYRNLIPAYVSAGKLMNARLAVGKLLLHYPGLTVEKVRTALVFSSDVMQRMCADLKQAGLPVR